MVFVERNNCWYTRIYFRIVISTGIESTWYYTVYSTKSAARDQSLNQRLSNIDNTTLSNQYKDITLEFEEERQKQVMRKWLKRHPARV